MTYKTKIGIAIGVGFGFIIVMSIVMAVFVSNHSGDAKIATSNQVQNTTNTINQEQNNEKEIPELSPNTEIEMEMSNVSSLGIVAQSDGNYLVKISDDLETENIVNLDNVEEFAGYDYEDNIVYLAFNQTGSSYIYSINLNDNSESFITEIEYNILNSIYVHNGNIYCETANNSIYEYNIQEETGEEIIIPDDGETIVKLQIDKENNILYYMKNIFSDSAESTAIYSYNLETNTEEQIINAGYNGIEISLYNNYLICNLMNTYFYVYNIETTNLWELGSVQESNINNVNRFAFLNDYIAFSDGKTIKITDYDGNTINGELYVAEENEEILGIIALTPNKLQISTRLNIETTKVIDFKASTINDLSENYKNILHIK